MTRPCEVCDGTGLYVVRIAGREGVELMLTCTRCYDAAVRVRRKYGLGEREPIAVPEVQ